MQTWMPIGVCMALSVTLSSAATAVGERPYWPAYEDRLKCQRSALGGIGSSSALQLLPSTGSIASLTGARLERIVGGDRGRMKRFI